MAIAGLIFAVVFAAFNYASNSRNDDARNEDAARYLQAAQQWITNNNGNLPKNVTNAQDIVSTYITSNGSTSYATPEGTPWSIRWGTGGPTSAGFLNNSEMLVYSPAACGTGGRHNHGPIVAFNYNQREVAVSFIYKSGVTACYALQ